MDVGDDSVGIGGVDRAAYGHISDRLETLNGREYVPGRRAAIGTLDFMLGKACNVQKLYVALQESFDNDPTEFLMTVGRAFITKRMMQVNSVVDTVDSDGVSSVDDLRKCAVRVLTNAVAIATENGDIMATVMAQKELNRLVGLCSDNDTIKDVSADTIRTELFAMQQSVEGLPGG